MEGHVEAIRQLDGATLLANTLLDTELFEHLLFIHVCSLASNVSRNLWFFVHQEKGHGLMIEDLLGAAPARQVRKDADVYGASGMQ